MLLWVLLIIGSATAKDPQDWDPAKDYVLSYKNRYRYPVGQLTTENGAAVCPREASSTLNKNLMLHNLFMESITHLVRERIPERIVHARGSGAFGYYEVTNDMSHICKTGFVRGVGKRTPVAVRFSPSTGERGISELNQDIRSFACKFYTEEGIFDVTALNIPVFVSNDPMDFSDVVHAIRRDGRTNCFSPHTLWDALTNKPESFFAFMYVLSKRGMPATYRHMPAFPIHTMQFENEKGELNFCRMSFEPDCGMKGIGWKEIANRTDPDFYTADLWREIYKKNFPSWTVYAQCLSECEARKNYSVFDATRLIPTSEYPLQEMGKLVLTRNPSNYHEDVEMIAFSPTNVLPGMPGAPGNLYAARRMAYRDAHMHRLGTPNFNRIPINCPFPRKTYSYSRDGAAPVSSNNLDYPNYRFNSFNGPVASCASESDKDIISIVEQKAYNFDQARIFYAEELTTEEQDDLIENFIRQLQKVAGFIQRKACKILYTIHKELGCRVEEGLKKAK